MTISLRNVEANAKTENLFADLISSARKATGYTLEQLAITSGLTTAEISAIENGRETEEAKIRRLASALRIPHEHFA